MKHEMFHQLDFEIEPLFTPFGNIQTVETDLLHTIKSSVLVTEIMNFSLEMKEDKEMTAADALAFFKNTTKRHPNEPLVFYKLGKSYFDLGKAEKFKQQVKENYERFKGYPIIDIAYADSLTKEAKIQFFKEEFGENLYLSDVYPDQEYFDLREVRLYYAIAIRILSDMKSFDKARQCLEITKKISNRDNILYMEKIIEFKQYPRKKWWNFTKIILFLLLLLGLVVSCIWGIISFFRWLF